MRYKNLIIINNEKIFKENNSFYCDNLDLKILPEELNEYHEVQYIVRSSNKKGSQKINLKNKTALVTGAGKGIGKACAVALAEVGANLIIISRTKKDLDKVSKIIRKFNSKCVYYVCDVTNYHQIKEIINKQKRIDILVNNAGIGKSGNILTTNNNDWDEIIKVNLTGTYLVTKHCLENLINSKNGSIVNIASVAGIVAVKDRFAYCTSKGGVISLTKSIALDFVKDNIRANAICPGTVNTPWVERITQDYENPDEARELMRQRQPLGRLGEPEEIAQAAIYLGSDESKFITGTTLVIDGGLTMS